MVLNTAVLDELMSGETFFYLPHTHTHLRYNGRDVFNPRADPGTEEYRGVYSINVFIVPFLSFKVNLMRGFSGCINHRQVVECFAWPSIEKLHKRYMATLVVNATTHLKKKKNKGAIFTDRPFKKDRMVFLCFRFTFYVPFTFCVGGKKVFVTLI